MHVTKTQRTLAEVSHINVARTCAKSTVRQNCKTDSFQSMEVPLSVRKRCTIKILDKDTPISVGSYVFSSGFFCDLLP